MEQGKEGKYRTIRRPQPSQIIMMLDRGLKDSTLPCLRVGGINLNATAAVGLSIVTFRQTYASSSFFTLVIITINSSTGIFILMRSQKEEEMLNCWGSLDGYLRGVNAVQEYFIGFEVNF